MDLYNRILQITGLVLDGVGVFIICLAAVFSSLAYARTFKDPGAFKNFRQSLGRGILLGLEFLIAGDIIRTVAVSPTMESVAVLGLIVLIRIFLSLSLESELGRPPWKSGRDRD